MFKFYFNALFLNTIRLLALLDEMCYFAMCKCKKITTL